MQHLNKYLSQNAVIADHFVMQKWYDTSVYSGAITKDGSIATFISCASSHFIMVTPFLNPS